MRTPGPLGVMAFFAVVCLVLGLRAIGRSGPRAESRPSTGTQPSEAGYARRIISRAGYDITPLNHGRINELAKDLTDQERRILLEKDTERPFCGLLLDNKEQGTYVCRLCGLPLFCSTAKFHSGTGWPSFFEPIHKEHIRYQRDLGHGMVRTEILCVRCGSHLGHVFEDGPLPTGMRYCLNSAALRFYSLNADLPPESRPIPTETAYFAGGCFWGIEDRFQKVPGVIDAVSGYQGGATSQPTYKQVCTGTTGHAETVRVTFDPQQVTYRQLLEAFFRFHDSTQVNRQGPDVGTQYRSAIFAANDEQLKKARDYIEELGKDRQFRGRRIATTVELAGPFYVAEEYHQDYHARHGGSCPLPQR